MTIRPGRIAVHIALILYTILALGPRSARLTAPFLILAEVTAFGLSCFAPTLPRGSTS